MLNLDYLCLVESSWRVTEIIKLAMPHYLPLSSNLIEDASEASLWFLVLLVRKLSIQEIYFQSSSPEETNLPTLISVLLNRYLFKSVHTPSIMLGAVCAKMDEGLFPWIIL